VDVRGGGCCWGAECGGADTGGCTGGAAAGVGPGAEAERWCCSGCAGGAAPFWLTLTLAVSCLQDAPSVRSG
jgi:hypothetical protein